MRTKEPESCLLKLALHRGESRALRTHLQGRAGGVLSNKVMYVLCWAAHSALTKPRGNVAAGTLEGAGLRGGGTTEWWAA